MNKDSNDYIPALRFNWLTSLYDPIVALTCREKVFKAKLIAQANLSNFHKVVDIGSGTGTLAMSIKSGKEGVSVIGIDADRKIISIAQNKARTAGLEIEFKRCMSVNTPFRNNQFDRCVSSLFFHHLTVKNKTLSLTEAFRILKPEGEIHIADWGQPTSLLMRFLFFFIQIIDGFETTSSCIKGELPELMAKSGFKKVTVVEEISTLFGTMALYSGKK